MQRTLAGVIHRDVKPANLIVGPDGTVKVTDFGIARAIGAASLTEAGQVIGTAHYMSPEQATGNPATSASDIYSLGVVAYEMFAGRRPFEADTPLAISMAHVHAPVPALPEGVPRGVAELITDALAKDPGSRPASAEDLRREGATRDARRSLGPHAQDSSGNAVPSVQPSLAPTRSGPGDGMADESRTWRPTPAPLLAFLAVFLLVAAGYGSSPRVPKQTRWTTTIH